MVATRVLVLADDESTLPWDDLLPPGATLLADPARRGPLAALADAWQPGDSPDDEAGGSAIVLAVDYPLVDDRFLAGLADLARAEPLCDAIVPVAGGQFQWLCAVYAPPARHRLRATVAAGIRAFHTAVGAAELSIRAVPEDEWSAWGAPDALLNVNSPPELERLRRYE